MRIFITGGLGFVGRHLSNALLDDGHRVTAVGRSRAPSKPIDHPSFSYVTADTTKSGNWQILVPQNDVVINLAGKSIFTLWTEKVKKELYDSRILTTRNLVQSLENNSDTLFFSTSAAGYYGDRGEDVLEENEPVGDDFLAHLAKDWEHEAQQAQSEKIRVVLTRFGIVLDRDGGAMASMIPAFKSFLGGRLGSGAQWVPWIHIQDLIGAYRYVMEHGDIAGPVNWCAPQPVRNRELTASLAEKLHRPVMLPTPALVVKTVLGEFGKALLCSQRAVPSVLLKNDFQFNYPSIAEALAEITH